MFDDRFEVESPGGLPGTVTVDNIKDKQFSRNPRIARVLAELEYITELGEGVNRMYREMKEFELPEPEIMEKDHAVITILRNNIEVVKALQKKMGTISLSDLNERQKRAIDYVKKRIKITNKEYQKINNVGRVYALRELTELMEKNIFKRRGRGRSTRYVLVSD